MKQPNIHPTAIIEPGASIGSEVVIEPYAVIKGNVVLHDRVVIKSHAYIDGYTTIGEGTIIYPSASIGTKTQALNSVAKKPMCALEKIARLESLSPLILLLKKTRK